MNEINERKVESELYSYQEPVAYLRSVYKKVKQNNPSYSIRAWARRCGMSNPSLLSAILRGERVLKPRVASKLIHTLHLNEKEKQYFELLVSYANAKSSSEKEVYDHFLRACVPGKQFLDLALERFRLISGWYHLAILETFQLKDFRESVRWISKRIGGISPSQVKEALRRLKQVGLVCRDEKGLLRKRNDPKVGDMHHPNEAIQQFHLQMLERAREALLVQPVSDRNYRCSLVAIQKKDYSKAVQIFKECHDKILALAAPGHADEVYAFQSQIFSITKGVKNEHGTEKSGNKNP